MIPFNFDYLQPATVGEALSAWNANSNSSPVYYAGGTEIITLCREQKIKPGAVIDIKKIPECRVFSEDSQFRYGSALTLNQIAEAAKLPFMRKIAEGIADHSIRNRLTLGGNIAGRLPYREAVLPFLALNGSAVLEGPEGRRTAEFPDIFDKRIKFKNGEFVTEFRLPAKSGNIKWYYRRREKESRIDYPLVSAFFVKDGDGIMMALSGVLAYPLRSRRAEEILNSKGLSISKKSSETVDFLKDLIRSDLRASADYRKHLLTLTISEALEFLEDHE